MTENSETPTPSKESTGRSGSGGWFKRYPIWLISLGIIGLLGICTAFSIWNVKRVDNLVSEGQEQLRAGNFSEAIAKFDQAIAEEPNNGRVHHLLGMAYFMRGNQDQGDIGKAISEFDIAIELLPPLEQARVYHDRGLAYSKQDDLEEAIENFSEAIRLNPSFVNAYISRGTAYAKQNQSDEALRDFAQAEANAENDVDAWINLGKAYVKLERLEDAIRSFDRAIELAPDNVEALTGRVNAYISRGNINKQQNPNLAITDFSTAIGFIESTPITQLLTTTVHAKAYLNRGQAYLEQATAESNQNAINDLTSAITILGEIQPQDDTVAALAIEAYNNLGLGYVRGRQWEQAIENLDRAIERKPDNATAHYYRGLAYLNKTDRDVPEAIKAFTRAIELDSDLLEAYHQLGFIHVEQKEFEQALRYFDVAIEKASELKRDGSADVYYYRGVHRAREAEPNLMAICDLEKAIQLADERQPPNDNLAHYIAGEAHFYLGLSYYRRGLAPVKPKCDFEVNASPSNQSSDSSGDNEVETPASITATVRLQQPEGRDSNLVAANSFLTYTLTYTNEGPGVAQNISITNTLQPANTFTAANTVAASPEISNPTWMEQQMQLIGFVPELDEGESVTITFSVSVITDTDLSSIPNLVITSTGTVQKAAAEKDEKLSEAVSETQPPELDFAKAITHFTTVIELNYLAKIIEAHYWRGLAYLELGVFDQAVVDFTKVIEAEPVSPDRTEAYIKRGVAYAELGQFDQALDDFDQGELDDAEAHYYRGLALAKQGKFELAIEEFSNAIEKKPDYVAAYISRGVAYAELGDFAKAIEDLKQAIELSSEKEPPSPPEQAKAHFNLGLVYANYDKLELAVDSFSKAIDILSETMTKTPIYRDALFNRGVIFIRLGEYDSAITDFVKVIEQDKNNANAYIHLGIAYSERGKDGDSKMAVDNYTKAIALNPDLVPDVIKLIGQLTNLNEVDLSRAHLPGIDLSGKDLSGANLNGADLTRANLTGTKLNGATLIETQLVEAILVGADMSPLPLDGSESFSQTNLTRANLSRADATGANMSQANLTGVKVRRTNLSGVDLSDLSENQLETILTGVDLRGAFLRGAVLSGTNLSGKDLSQANLEGANLEGAKLEGAKLIAASMNGAKFSDETDLSGADLNLANLSGVDLSSDFRPENLREANLTGIILSAANLRGIDLSGKDLRGANLNGADLSGNTKLNGANLSGTYLIGTRLGGADLRGANLSHANLNGADLIASGSNRTDLRGANLIGIDLTGAKYDNTTIWPPEFVAGAVRDPIP